MFESPESIVNRAWHIRLTVEKGLSSLLGATLFPPRCCLCGFEGQPPDLDLCDHCQSDLPWDEVGDWPQTAVWCRTWSPDLLTALRYEDPAADLIRRLKYGGAVAHARVLGEMLALAAKRRAGQLPRLLVAVPLHDARFRERGFNQAAAIAKFAGRRLGIPYAQYLLRRLRDTPSQTALDREQRRLNVRGAFAVAHSRARRRLLEAAHVAVVDDVTTTGSTLAELKALLLEAGVRRIERWAVARAL
jgi:ComF family protein